MSEETRRLARELREHFLEGARTGRTGPHLTPILNILVERRTDTEAAQIYHDYEEQFNQSFAEDLRHFIDRVQEDMRQTVTDSFLVRIRQAGLNPLGGPMQPPPAVGYSGSREQISDWCMAFREYFESRQASVDVADESVVATAVWVLRNWMQLHETSSSRGAAGRRESVEPTAAWRHLVMTCGWLPPESAIFRASFAILSQNPRSREIGRAEGVRYFRGIRDAIRGCFNTMMAEATQYQETYASRCQPHQHGVDRLLGRAPSSPVDNTQLAARMHAWAELLTRCGATTFPVLSEQEKQDIRHLPAVADCWALPPAPGHTCQTEAQRAHLASSAGVL